MRTEAASSDPGTHCGCLYQKRNGLNDLKRMSWGRSSREGIALTSAHCRDCQKASEL